MKNSLQFLILLYSLVLSAQSAPNYYSNINFDLEGEPMKNALANLITESHDSTVDYNELWEILSQTDLNPQNSNNVLLIYGWNNTNAEDDDDYDRDKDATCGNGNPCTDETWNREHVFPKALDESGSDDSGPTADPHMLRSSDVEMNGLRANRMFSEGNGTASYTIGNDRFYPGDNWRGDVARIIMYMYVRYGEQWNPNLVGDGSNSYHNDMPDIFLEWNAEDPVEQHEINRNNIVRGYQGNRNPFIDNPYLATIIWGGPAGENTWPDTLGTAEFEENTIRVYPNPTADYVEIAGLSPESRVRVYNSLGQLERVQINRGKIHLPYKGLYLLHVEDRGKQYTYKVIRD